MGKFALAMKFSSMAASAKSRTRRKTGIAAQKRRARWPIWLAIAAAIGALLWWAYGTQAMGYSRTATAYVARVACSCHYIGGRTIDDCKKDRLEGMDLVTVTADSEQKSVTARFPLLASDTAYFRAGYGCVMDAQD